jgi:acyl carrier protein
MGEIMKTYSRVRTIVAGLLTIREEQVTPEASLQDDLGADSLALVEISMAIEEQFDIHLDDEEAFALKTVQQIVDCIETKTGSAAGAKVAAVAGAAQ